MVLPEIPMYQEDVVSYSLVEAVPDHEVIPSLSFDGCMKYNFIVNTSDPLQITVNTGSRKFRVSSIECDPFVDVSYFSVTPYMAEYNNDFTLTFKQGSESWSYIFNLYDYHLQLIDQEDYSMYRIIDAAVSLACSLDVFTGTPYDYNIFWIYPDFEYVEDDIYNSFPRHYGYEYHCRLALDQYVNIYTDVYDDEGELIKSYKSGNINPYNYSYMYKFTSNNDNRLLFSVYSYMYEVLTNYYSDYDLKVVCACLYEYGKQFRIFNGGSPI